MDLDPTTLTAIIAILINSGILAAVARWVWGLEPRLQAGENVRADLQADFDELRQIHNQDMRDLRDDHEPKITQNRDDIAAMKNRLGVIDSQVKHNGQGIDRILHKLDK